MESWREQLYDNELYHHGILGMRWGVRRYQNPDGSLTPAGRKRLKKMNEKFVKTEQKKLAKAEKKFRKEEEKRIKKEESRMSVRELQKSNKKDLNINKKKIDAYDKKLRSKQGIKSLTDDELRDLVDRLDLEKRYKELNNISTKSASKQFKDKMVDKGTDLASDVTIALASKFISDKFGLKINTNMFVTKQDKEKSKLDKERHELDKEKQKLERDKFNLEKENKKIQNELNKREADRKDFEESRNWYTEDNKKYANETERMKSETSSKSSDYANKTERMKAETERMKAQTNDYVEKRLAELYKNDREAYEEEIKRRFNKK